MNAPLALWHDSAGKSSIRPAGLVQNLPHAVRLKSLYSLISTGTERLVASGQVPEELYDSMQVPYMEGDFGFPVKYGYSLVAEVMEADHPLFGARVHLLHPHQNMCRVATSDFSLIPEQVPARRATLASNMETALNAIWDSGISIGDRVLLIGFGIIGALLAELIRQIPAVSLQILEKNTARQKRLQQWGFIPFDEQQISAGFDLCFHCSGSESGLQMGIDRLAFEGKLIELSWYGQKSVQLQLGGSFHQQRKQIISSQVGQIPGHKSARWDYRRRKEVVFQLLEQPVFDQYITEWIPFEDLPDHFDALRKNQPDGIATGVQFST